MSIQTLIQSYQPIILEHERKTNHHSFSIRGTNKKEKCVGVYCRDCKRFITPIRQKPKIRRKKKVVIR